MRTVRANEADFYRIAGMWRLAAESRGRQMVAAGALTDREREAVVADYTDWMQRPGAAVTVHEGCVIGRRPGAGHP